MKKILLVFGLIWVGFSIHAQHDIRLDVENVMVCLVDSVSNTEQNIFYRIKNVHDGITQDVDYKLQSPYTVTGTVLPCSDVGGNATAGGCLVRNILGHDFADPTNSPTYSPGSFNSIAVTVLTGVVTITAPDLSGTPTDVPYTAGFSFSWTADLCKYNLNEIIVNAANGTAVVSYKY